ncbi:glycosyltransferase family 2 protein [Fomitiporia mediterranea MF3/22]|uniref:glycosyltransferase family 2 protein n=1 Tax=Fomitiporia mediterranea (strain MF3/22) TaxID=694068 RepID=UPI0004409312|nr:glycosyltransferase family 2 protein [Fomitiporia mediterranea MF3/22]EJD03256.1 glycosyltransferase family 2 protein [Fomitiporia mediterranea MF3/22]
MSQHARFAPASYERSDVPIPTTRPPAPAGTIRRAKTLTRPERGIAPVPLIKPTVQPNGTSTVPSPAADSGWDIWSIFSRIITFWAPGVLLSSIGGLKTKAVRQAWREKVALCFIALLLGGIVGFATVGMQRVLCPSDSDSDSDKFARLGTVQNAVGIQGYTFIASPNTPSSIIKLSQQLPSQDITPLFQRDAANFPSCKGLSFRVAVDQPCNSQTNCTLGSLNSTSTFSGLGLTNNTLLVGYDWDQVANLENYFVIDGAVLNMNPYMSLHRTPITGDNVDLALRTLLNSQSTSSGNDGTRLFYGRDDLKTSVGCLKERYYAGNIDKITPGCFVSQLVLYAGLIVILGLVLVRFVMACFFSWVMSGRLAGPPDPALLRKTTISPAVMPGGANVAVDNRTGTAPWANGRTQKGARAPTKLIKPSNSSTTLVGGSDTASPTITLEQIGAELFAVCLVTCYSEGESSLRTTLDSISLTNYADERKLLFVVADGMITGAGEKRSTPDICVSLLEADPRFGDPMPMSYIAVGSGKKRENRAMVYAGHYRVAGRRTPTVVIVKCGTESEAQTDKKPGNRGKRDSQLILMNFFSRVTYNDRMSPLDFDLFRKIHVLMGVTPDFFEVCLMVDADTKAYPNSLRYLVNCMHHDQMIMGVCGETRIENKRQSWVTAIQVYEYFISHHLAKAFESVFGGVTCLPGCFSMFRLKVRKMTGDDWVPLITKPEIIREYSQSEVSTLHQKNLLLLGEDRFLTTLLLRTFPNRKMMFLPQAKCRTVVPDEFKVLLSQRRRWINSTIHNLMELVLVRNLCGTFCFSMQFIVFMDLLGTVVLPVAIALTYSLVVGMAMDPPKTFEEAIPLILLLAVIGLPGVLILITTRKIVYVFWMFIYLMALPIWNFVLPVYSFWHFDDFSWGETRKVEGERKGAAHGDGEGVFNGTSVPMRRWEDWERSRLRKMKREERRRRDMERAFPSGYNSGGNLGIRSERSSQYDGSDTVSVTSSEDDVWGPQIGAYNENNPAYPPPPTGVLLPRNDVLQSAGTVNASDLEAMLEVGFDSDQNLSRQNLLQSSSTSSTNLPRYQLSDGPVGGGPGRYTPVSRTEGGPVYAPPVMSPITPSGPNVLTSGYNGVRTHARQRSGGRGGPPGPNSYGPLGPLDPSNRI